MNKRVYSIIEIVLSIIFIATGLTVAINTELIQNSFIWVLTGFFVIRIAFVVSKHFAFKKSKVYTILQSVLNAGAIILMIVLWYVFGEGLELPRYVVAVVSLIDLITNIVKAFIFKKTKDTESFFGMDNVISAIFIVLMCINITDASSVVLLGLLILYKGVVNILSNHYLKKVISLTDLGKALNKVHALDVLFGLFIVLLLASFILPYEEASIVTVGDAWWYSFALITTIGFGDMVATSTVGRIISVIIGFYGIIIVSLLTSSIVVYITEENKKAEEKEKEQRVKEFLEESKVESTKPNKNNSKKDQISLFESSKPEASTSETQPKPKAKKKKEVK